MNKLPFWAIIFCVTLLGSVRALAVNQGDSIGSDQWELKFTPYFWLAGLKADSSLGGLTGSADIDFSEIFDALEFGASGRFEAWKKRWGLFIDASYLDLGADYSNTFGPLGKVAISADADWKLGTVDFGVAYRLVDTLVGKNQTQRLAVEPLAGLRYQYFKQELKLNAAVAGVGGAGTKLGGDEDWVEPFVGSRVSWQINDKLTAIVRGDIGGFGIGSASKLTWNFLVGVDWRFKENKSLKVGYRITDIDYEGGSGPSRIGIDGKMSGPIIGLTWRFK